MTLTGPYYSSYDRIVGRYTGNSDGMSCVKLERFELVSRANGKQFL